MERMIRKIKIDLQVIMIIWGEETKPLSPLSLFSFFSIYFFVFILGFFGFFRGWGGRRLFRPLWIRQWDCSCEPEHCLIQELRITSVKNI